MRLYILRHGRAVEADEWSGDDASRPLTDEGRAELRTAARGLEAMGIHPSVALTSPFVRAADTAHIVAERLHTPVREEPDLSAGLATLGRVVPLLAAQADDADVLLVGHEPDLSTLLGDLIGRGTTAAVRLKKAACARVDIPPHALRRAALDGAGELAWLLTARHLVLIGGA